MASEGKGKRRAEGLDRSESLGQALNTILPKDQRHIQTTQFHSLCYALGYFLKEEEQKEALKKLDPHNIGKVELQPFIDWWGKEERFSQLQLPPREMMSMLKCVEYYQYFDRDHDGTLGLPEFEALHEDLRRRGVTASTFRETLSELGLKERGDSEQIVSFRAYVDWMVQHGKLEANLPRLAEAQADDSYTDTTDGDDDDDDDDDCFDEEDDEDEILPISSTSSASSEKVPHREVSMLLMKARDKAAEEAREEQRLQEEAKKKAEQQKQEQGRPQSGKMPAINALIDEGRLHASTVGEGDEKKCELNNSKVAGSNPGVSGAESRSSKPGGERLNFSGLDGQSPEYVSTAQQELAGAGEKRPGGGCPHIMKKYHFSSPTWCTSCGKFLWGLGKQGYVCTVCGEAYHPGDCVMEQVNQQSRILKAGWLYKIGSAKKDAETGKWQKRFFVLSNDYLLYFKTSKKKELLGALPVTPAIKAEPEGDGSPTGFVIRTAHRNMHLRAVSKQDLESWYHFVEKAAQKA